MVDCAYGYIRELIDWFYGDVLPAIFDTAAGVALTALNAANAALFDAIEAGMDALQAVTNAVANTANAGAHFLARFGTPQCAGFAVSAIATGLTLFGPQALAFQVGMVFVLPALFGTVLALDGATDAPVGLGFDSAAEILAPGAIQIDGKPVSPVARGLFARAALVSTAWSLAGCIQSAK